ncbi:MAG: polysaccharide deacetylase family protein [Acidobacteriia bacterium]|nr:polysaccharide deacetylase family protein [Terriglobia bacterium]
MNRLRVAIAIGVVTAAVSAVAQAPAPSRPLLVTVDDLPVAMGRLHSEPAEREMITKDLLAVLARHHVRAVAFVIWGNVSGPADVALLGRWLAAGHELGNHSKSHPDYSNTGAEAYIADVEAGRAGLAGLMEAHGREVRFFRFPYLEEGGTQAEVDAVRSYLERSGQRNVPVTIDGWDWSYEERWGAAKRAGDHAAMQRIGEDYQAALRVAALTQTRLGDSLFGRPVPQVLLLHANAIGAAQWDAAFTWLSRRGYRFAGVDEVMADSALASPPRFVAGAGGTVWERVASARGSDAARAHVTALLQEQAAAWNRGDLDAFCAVYDEDAVFLTPSGLARGRQAVLERYRTRYPTTEAMGALTLEPIEFRDAGGIGVDPAGGLGPDKPEGLSLVARWTLRTSDGTLRTGLTLLVLHRRGETWRIVQDASM